MTHMLIEVLMVTAGICSPLVADSGWQVTANVDRGVNALADFVSLPPRAPHRGWIRYRLSREPGARWEQMS